MGLEYCLPIGTDVTYNVPNMGLTAMVCRTECVTRCQPDDVAGTLDYSGTYILHKQHIAT